MKQREIMERAAELNIIAHRPDPTIDGTQIYCFFEHVKTHVYKGGATHSYNPYVGYCHGEKEAASFLEEYEKDRSYRKP